MADLSYIGENINKLLQLRGMTQADLARKTGAGFSTVNAWCSGTKVPSLAALINVADALGVGPDDLIVPLTYDLTGESEMTEPYAKLYYDLFGVGYGDIPDRCADILNDVMAESLTEKERKVIEGRYGLNGIGKQSLASVAESMGISRERVRQKGNSAKEKLRKRRYALLPGSEQDDIGRGAAESGFAWADSIPTGSLNISTRTLNCLRRYNVKTLGDILRLKESDMDCMKGLGAQSAGEVKRLQKLIWSNRDIGSKILTMV